MRLDDDDFTLFGLPVRFDIDRQEIDDRWRALQSQVHPDRFASEGAAAQRLAMQWAMRVNEAHRRLRDPLARAAYLCELRGAAVNAERHTAMPQAFLIQQMQWRERLEEADSPDEVQALGRDVANQERAMFDTLARELDELGNPRDAAETVRALMFMARFRDDLDRRLELLER